MLCVFCLSVLNFIGFGSWCFVQDFVVFFFPPLIFVCCVFNVISIMCSPTLIKTSKKINKFFAFIGTHQKMLGFAFVFWVLEQCVFGVFDFVLMCCGLYGAWCVLEVCFMWCILEVCWKFVVNANVLSNIHTSYFLRIWCVFLCFMSPIYNLLVVLKDGTKELLKPYNQPSNMTKLSF